ncbi:MAG: DUF4390 domain-containing protein [Methylococcaceae bacterium]
MNNSSIFILFIKSSRDVAPQRLYHLNKLCSYFLIILLSLFSNLAIANQQTAQIKTISTTIENKQYTLSADLNYALSAEVKDALQNGVPLFWQVQIKIQQARPLSLLWHKTLREFDLRYRLQYHVLLNMYRVNNETTGEVANFSTLPAALDLMATLRHIPLIAIEKVAANRPSFIALKINFDRNALPLPLRQTTYLDTQWYLSSDWTQWQLSE